MFNYSVPDFSIDEIKWDVAKRMHDERTRNELTLEALAELLHYTKPTVQSWEKDWKHAGTVPTNTIPSWDQLLKICELYKCDMGYILCEYDERTREIAEVSSQTGLTEKSISVLKNLFFSELDYPASSQSLETPSGYDAISLNDQARLILLAYANHLISNLNSFETILSEMTPLTLLRNEYDSDPDHRIIQEGINYIFRKSNFTYENISSSNILDNTECIKLFSEFIVSVKGFDFDLEDPECRSSVLIRKFERYKSIFDDAIFRKLNFIISDAFLDITKNFFSNINEEWNTYLKFLLPQRIKHKSLQE